MPLATEGPLPPLDQIANPSRNATTKDLADELRMWAEHLRSLKRRTGTSNHIMLALAAAADRLDPPANAPKGSG